MSVLERIGQLREEAEAEIAAAADTAELEELRVRYLGRKAELTSILRGIAELPPEERGPVGKAGQRGPRGARVAARRPRPRSSTPPSSTPARRGPHRRDPARRAPARRAPATS